MRCGIVHIAVIAQGDGEIRAGFRDGQSAVLHRDVVVGGHVVFTAHNHHIIRRCDGTGVLSHLGAACAERHIVGVAIHKTLVLSTIHRQRVDGDEVTSISLVFALSGHRHRAFRDGQLRRCCGHVLVVRVRTLHVNRVLARIRLRQTGQVGNVGAALLETVAVCGGAGSGCATHCLRVRMRLCIIHILVVIQRDFEFSVRSRDGQRAVFHRNIVVGGHVVFTAHDYHIVLCSDNPRVITNLCAACAERRVMRVSVHKACIFSAVHRQIVDGDGAASVFYRIARRGECHRTLRDGQRRRVAYRTVAIGGFHQVGQRTRIRDAGYCGSVVAPRVAGFYLVLERGISLDVGRCI